MIEVNNKSQTAISAQDLKKIGQEVLRREKQAKEIVSVALVKPSVMKALNAKYRKKDYIANVLSFRAGNERISGKDEREIGEVILCPTQIRKDAKTYGILWKEEFARVFIHGLLHVLGYNHEKSREKAYAMEIKERLYFSLFFPRHS